MRSGILFMTDSRASCEPSASELASLKIRCMTASMSTPAFKLLSIVTIFEGAGPVEEALARFGIRGFTTWAARGRGAHGRRRGGILEADNQFYQVVTTP